MKVSIPLPLPGFSHPVQLPLKGPMIVLESCYRSFCPQVTARHGGPALDDFHLMATDIVEDLDLASEVLGDASFAKPTNDPFYPRYFEFIERHRFYLNR
jgi:hypothetical protein